MAEIPIEDPNASPHLDALRAALEAGKAALATGEAVEAERIARALLSLVKAIDAVGALAAAEAKSESAEGDDIERDRSELERRILDLVERARRQEPCPERSGACGGEGAP